MIQAQSRIQPTCSSALLLSQNKFLKASLLGVEGRSLLVGRKGYLINPSVLTFSLPFLSGGLADFLMYRICVLSFTILVFLCCLYRLAPQPRPLLAYRYQKEDLETITSWHGLSLEELNIYERILNMLNMLVQTGKVSLELEYLELKNETYIFTLGQF